VLLEFVKRCPVAALHMTPALCDAITSATVSAYRRREAITMLLGLWKAKVPVPRQYSTALLACLDSVLQTTVASIGT
jgi:hypothetical protein